MRYATVHAWVQAWQAGGTAGLAEGPRSCRRSLKGKRDALAFAAMQQQLVDWHAAEARGEVGRGLHVDDFPL